MLIKTDSLFVPGRILKRHVRTGVLADMIVEVIETNYNYKYSGVNKDIFRGRALELRGIYVNNHFRLNQEYLFSKVVAGPQGVWACRWSVYCKDLEDYVSLQGAMDLC